MIMIEDIFEFGVCVLISSLLVYGEGVVEWLSKLRGTPDIDLDGIK